MFRYILRPALQRSPFIQFPFIRFNSTKPPGPKFTKFNKNPKYGVNSLQETSKPKPKPKAWRSSKPGNSSKPWEKYKPGISAKPWEKSKPGKSSNSLNRSKPWRPSYQTRLPQQQLTIASLTNSKSNSSQIPASIPQSSKSPKGKRSEASQASEVSATTASETSETPLSLSDYRNQVLENDKKKKPADQPEYIKRKRTLQKKHNYTAWNPKKKLSREDMEKLRELKAMMPYYKTIDLSKIFRISPEAVRRILKSKFQRD